MRKVIFGGASTLDNFLARTNDAVDWILWGEEAAAVMAEYWARFDTIVMGRKTHEVAMRQGHGGGYPGVKTFICSRTLPESSDQGVIVHRDAVELIRGLKKQEGKDICLMGGGDLARSLFEADLIDEIGLNIHPVLIGSGVPLFHGMSRQIDLELNQCKPFKNGCVLVTYSVKHGVGGSATA